MHTPGYHAIARPSVERLKEFVEAIEVSGRQKEYRSWRMVAVEDELAWRVLGAYKYTGRQSPIFPTPHERFRAQVHIAATSVYSTRLYHLEYG